MTKFLLRNDDCAFDTSLQEIRTFCDLCDRYGFRVLHAITPIGAVRHIDAAWDNDRIRRESGNRLFLDNTPVLEYLQARRDLDLFAVHGLWHTHAVSRYELDAAEVLLDVAGVDITWQVPPFNDPASRGSEALHWSGPECPRLEAYLERPAALPETDIAYLHSWRFEHGPFAWAQLERCLKALAERCAHVPA